IRTNKRTTRCTSDVRGRMNRVARRRVTRGAPTHTARPRSVLVHRSMVPFRGSEAAVHVPEKLPASSLPAERLLRHVLRELHLLESLAVVLAEVGDTQLDALLNLRLRIRCLLFEAFDLRGHLLLALIESLLRFLGSLS